MIFLSIKPCTIIPQNAGSRISEDLNFKISRGSMPPDPPRWARLFEPPQILGPPLGASMLVIASMKLFKELL